MVPTCVSNELIVDKVLYSSNYATIVKDTEGKIWTWGANAYGSCGTGNTESILSPTNISDATELEGKSIAKVEFVKPVVIATDEEGKVYTWGANNYGQCGTGDTTNFAKPKCINNYDGLENIIFNSFTYNENDEVLTAKDSEGKIWKCGKNTKGEIGLGVEGNVLRPICATDYYNKIGFNPDECKVISYGDTKIAIDINGKVWTWGDNTKNLCGIGKEQEIVTEPVCLTINNETFNLKNSLINNDNTVIYALKEQGTAWVWGNTVLQPVNLKECEEMKGKAVKEILSTNGVIYAMTEDSKIYSVNLENGLVIKEESWSIPAYGGVGQKQFRIVTNSK